MFLRCNSIIEMNFTKFDATKCMNLNDMFNYDSSLISLDLSGFITTTYVNSIANMFYDCHSLVSLNLSTFDTSNVINFGHLFTDCKELKWIDISIFLQKKHYS